MPKPQKRKRHSPTLDELHAAFQLTPDLATRARLLMRMIRKMKKENPKLLLSLEGKLAELRDVLNKGHEQ